MAAVTSAVVAVGGLGLSAAQAVKANKDMKLAGAASQKASAELKGIKEQNAFKNVQVPTLGFDLAQQAGAQRDAQALSAIQGAGAAGVIGGVGQLAQAGLQQDLQLAAAGQNAQYDRDLQQANAGQGIEARRAEREFNIGMGEKQDFEIQRAEAEARKAAAIQGMVTSAGTALTSVGGMLDLYQSKKSGFDKDRVTYTGKKEDNLGVTNQSGLVTGNLYGGNQWDLLSGTPPFFKQ